MGSKPRTLSVPAVAVLRAVADGRPYGFDIMDATNLPSGTVYPILSRFLKAGVLRSRWEHATAARRDKRPPRKYYELTPAGQIELQTALAQIRALGAGVSQEALQSEGSS